MSSLLVADSLGGLFAVSRRSRWPAVSGDHDRAPEWSPQPRQSVVGENVNVRSDHYTVHKHFYGKRGSEVPQNAYPRREKGLVFTQLFQLRFVALTIAHYFLSIPGDLLRWSWCQSYMNDECDIHLKF